MHNTWWAKTLRIVGIVLMALTAAFTIMGGAGTSCVALNPTGYEGKFAGIAPFQWLYIAFVLVTLVIGVFGVRAVVLLVKGTKDAYRQSMIVLVAGVLVGAIHIIASRSLRGGSMPVDMVVYATVLTLLVFLLFKFPAIWQGVNFEKPAGGGKMDPHIVPITLAATGLLTLIIQFLMAPTHTIGGFNYADAWHATLTLLGAGQILIGACLALYRLRILPQLTTKSRRHEVTTKFS
jgi:uncharacterized membrane protein (UPF0136 family)